MPEIAVLLALRLSRQKSEDKRKRYRLTAFSRTTGLLKQNVTIPLYAQTHDTTLLPVPEITDAKSNLHGLFGTGGSVCAQTVAAKCNMTWYQMS